MSSCRIISTQLFFSILSNISNGGTGRRGRRPLPMKCYRTSFQLLSAFAIRKSAAIFFNAAILSILCGIRKTTKRGQVIFLQIRHEGTIENIIQKAEKQKARRKACFGVMTKSGNLFQPLGEGRRTRRYAARGVFPPEKQPPFCFILPQEKVLGKMHKHARLQTQKNTPPACSFGFMMLAYFSSISEGSHMEGAS